MRTLLLACAALLVLSTTAPTTAQTVSKKAAPADTLGNAEAQRYFGWGVEEDYTPAVPVKNLPWYANLNLPGINYW